MTCEEFQTIWCLEASVEGLRQECRLRVVQEGGSNRRLEKTA